MRPHEAQIGTQIGKTLPVVARHASQERMLAVDHFVVREWQDKALRKRIEHAEGQRIVVMPAVNRLMRNVVERVVHPAHVPLVMEPETTLMGRTSDAGPG